ncbi:MAG TPA: RagB/SusD family nutrient uptake outer membrane protein [Puia sp.]|jgi:hypothetical protein|nr:RagB/SusD family nutrient uptake outer membrane protein [Puia sp.]
MNRFKYLKVITAILGITSLAACTKLDQHLQSTLTQTEAANSFNAALFLQSAYNDVGNPYSDLGNIFALEEVTSDECVVPTRGGDWDDNGKWRALHQHAWAKDGVDIFLSMFNALNKIQFDATNVFTFKPNATQIAQAKFIRAISLYQLFDLWNQFPFRNPGDTLLNAPKVMRGAEAIQFIIDDLNSAIADLPEAGTNGVNVASKDAARVLLMRLYLNRGAFLNRAAPTWPDDDMQKVIAIGDTIINSGHYSYMANYFDNFNSSNSTSTEAIFACPNKSGVATNNTNISNRWYAPLHYNQWSVKKGAAGWNGFSTVASTYDMFQTNGSSTARGPADTLIDKRIGGRFYPGVTNISGVRPGFLIGQQYDEKGQKYVDRKNPPNSLIFDPNINPSLKETGNNLELTGIRVIKYPPDYSQGTASYDNGGNWMVLFRYPEVVLMVAEAKMRAAAPDNAGALTMVNALRTVRGAAPLATMTLFNPANVYDPNTLLAERGRELYWEDIRRTDLIRFGVFLNPWEYKAASTAKFLLFPLPSQALSTNPNLIQNTGF